MLNIKWIPKRNPDYKLMVCEVSGWNPHDVQVSTMFIVQVSPTLTGFTLSIELAKKWK